MFGPNAQVDVPGALHVTTADELRFADGATFSATNPETSTLTLAPPEAFGFLGNAPGSIRLEGSNLQLAPGKPLSLVGGDVELQGSSRIRTPGGQVNVTSLAAPATVNARTGAVAEGSAFGRFAMTASSIATGETSWPIAGVRSGPVAIRAGEIVIDQAAIAAINGSSEPGGNVSIKSDALTLSGGSGISSSTVGNGPGGAISVSADRITFDNGNLFSGTEGRGASGDVTVTADELSLVNGGSISSDTDGGKAGEINVTANRMLLVSGDGSGIFSTAELLSTGSAGDVQVTANEIVIDQAAIWAIDDSSEPGGNVSIKSDVLTLSGGGIYSLFSGTQGNAGAVTVTGRDITVRNGGQIASNTFAQSNAGAVTVQADYLLVSGDGSGIFSTPALFSTGSAGDVQVTADHLEVLKGGNIESSTRSLNGGKAGTVNVKANHLLVSGDGAVSTISSTAEEGSTGSAGDVQVTADVLQVLKGGMISSSTFGEGDAGTVDVQADHLLVSEDGSAWVTGITSTAEEYSTGSAGDVHIKANDLQVRNGGIISTSTYSSGHAGTVDVQADHLLVSTDGSEHVTGITSTAEPYSADQPQPHSGPLPTGNAGMVKVTVTHELELHDGGQISSDTLTQGNAGQITVKADHVLVEGTDPAGHPSVIGSSAASSSTALHSGPLPTGAAGTVTVTATHELELHDGGQISSDTLTQGNAGQITVKADRVVVEGTDPAGGPSTVSTSTVGPGSGGAVKVEAGTLELTGGGWIQAVTADTGKAGDVSVEARDTVTISGRDASGAPSSLLASSLSPVADAGAGGTVDVVAPVVQVRDGGRIATSSRGGNVAGDIMITAADTLRLDQGAISTQAKEADGGRVTIRVGNLIDLQDSAITTSVAGLTGNGGNITIDPSFLILDNSRIVAQARGGNGGNIFIDAGTLIQSPGSVIDATSELGISGTINLTAPNVDVASSLVMLPETFLDASSQLREACAGQGGRPTSSLVAGGQGGLPPDPGRPLSASPSGLSSERRAEPVPNRAATLPLPPSTKRTLIAGNPILGAPRISCLG
jgi:large exoprotein involved in heme utilization and adhesion